ncbi:MAG: FAD-dependent oxidoreductase [Ruthenibacterium lactatiformans]
MKAVNYTLWSVDTEPLRLYGARTNGRGAVHRAADLCRPGGLWFSRVMGTCMALGEAAGLAAALCVRLNCTPAQVPVENLRALLKENGAVLTIPQEVASHENVEKSAI